MTHNSTSARANFAQTSLALMQVNGVCWVKMLNLKDLFDASTYQLSIPEYQRPYEWKEEDVQALLSDIKGISQCTGIDQFLLLGSVTLCQDSLHPEEFDVVDGQQRLSTLVLLFSAIFCRISIMQQDQLQDSFTEEEIEDHRQQCKRFSAKKSILQVRNAEGGHGVDDSAIRLTEVWKALDINKLAAVPDSSATQDTKDIYSKRWRQIYDWLGKQYKKPKQIQEVLQHVLNKVHVTITVVKSARLAMKSFVRCNSSGDMLWHINMFKHVQSLSLIYTVAEVGRDASSWQIHNSASHCSAFDWHSKRCWDGDVNKSL